jgi:hypothetical protein
VDRRIAVRLYIPEISDVITLAKDWTFGLYDESRNAGIINGLDLYNHPEYTWACLHSAPHKPDRRNSIWQATLPQGTKLKVDRIYIRKGISAYSSITFFINECPLKELTPKKKGGTFESSKKVTSPNGKHEWLERYQLRFWAKLADVNTMEIVEEECEAVS